MKDLTRERFESAIRNRDPDAVQLYLDRLCTSWISMKKKVYFCDIAYLFLRSVVDISQIKRHRGFSVDSYGYLRPRRTMRWVKVIAIASAVTFVLSNFLPLSQ